MTGSRCVSCPVDAGTTRPGTPPTLPGLSRLAPILQEIIERHLRALSVVGCESRGNRDSSPHSAGGGACYGPGWSTSASGESVALWPEAMKNPGVPRRGSKGEHLRWGQPECQGGGSFPSKTVVGTSKPPAPAGTEATWRRLRSTRVPAGRRGAPEQVPSGKPVYTASRCRCRHLRDETFSGGTRRRRKRNVTPMKQTMNTRGGGNHE